MDERHKVAFVKAGLRRASYRWPARNEALIAARISRGMYKCAACGGAFQKKFVALDHIDPVVPPEGFTTWDIYINRLFIGVEGWQVLCKEDHLKKSKIEAGLRKLARDESKKTLTKSSKRSKI